MTKNINLSSLSREELEQEYLKLHTEYTSAMAKAAWYEEQFRLSRQKRFGASSETGVSGQMSFEDLMLFNEAEALLEPIVKEPDLSSYDKTSSSGPGKKSSKKKDLKMLPVYEEVFELTPEEQICPTCKSPLHYVKDIVRMEIEILPAVTRVHRYVSKVYACRNCEKNKTASFVTAPGAPVSVIRNSPASPSAIADFLYKKYVLGTPFYRLEQSYESANIPITRNNMCHWSIKVAQTYYEPIINRMHDILMNEAAIHCDETYTEVLHEPDRPATRKSYIWVTATGEYQKEHPIALYNYREGRSAMDARAVLAGFHGYVMCDGYKSYDAITKTGKHGEPPLPITLVACMVHVRRYFVEALKLVKPDDREGTGAQEAVNKIELIFRIDRTFDTMSPEERYEARLKHLKPALDAFFEWAKQESEIALPKSRYGMALSYALEQREKVLNVLLDGRLELQNNLAERTVKPFVIGRKNWLFSDTVRGAKASCIIYSLVETAKLNHLNPYEYLKYLLEVMPDPNKYTADKLDDLLPWSDKLPAYIRKPAEK